MMPKAHCLFFKLPALRLTGLLHLSLRFVWRPRRPKVHSAGWARRRREKTKREVR